jgi:hypothetical protein
MVGNGQGDLEFEDGIGEETEGGFAPLVSMSPQMKTVYGFPAYSQSVVLPDKPREPANPSDIARKRIIDFTTSALNFSIRGKSRGLGNDLEAEVREVKSAETRTRHLWKSSLEFEDPTKIASRRRASELPGYSPRPSPEPSSVKFQSPTRYGGEKPSEEFLTDERYERSPMAPECCHESVNAEFTGIGHELADWTKGRMEIPGDSTPAKQIKSFLTPPTRGVSGMKQRSNVVEWLMGDLLDLDYDGNEGKKNDIITRVRGAVESVGKTDERTKFDMEWGDHVTDSRQGYLMPRDQIYSMFPA